MVYASKNMDLYGTVPLLQVSEIAIGFRQSYAFSSNGIINDWE
jgi:hypothetical protein